MSRLTSSSIYDPIVLRRIEIFELNKIKGIHTKLPKALLTDIDAYHCAESIALKYPYNFLYLLVSNAHEVPKMNSFAKDKLLDILNKINNTKSIVYSMAIDKGDSFFNAENINIDLNIPRRVILLLCMFFQYNKNIKNEEFDLLLEDNEYLLYDVIGILPFTSKSVNATLSYAIYSLSWYNSEKLVSICSDYFDKISPNLNFDNVQNFDVSVLQSNIFSKSKEVDYWLGVKQLLV